VVELVEGAEAVAVGIPMGGAVVVLTVIHNRKRMLHRAAELYDR
jgi:hypothetical protein